MALAKLRLLAGSKGVATITEHMTDVQIAFHSNNLDYDARAVRELDVVVERTQYPPGFSIKRRGVDAERMLEAISGLLYACA